MRARSEYAERQGPEFAPVSWRLIAPTTSLCAPTWSKQQAGSFKYSLSVYSPKRTLDGPRIGFGIRRLVRILMSKLPAGFLRNRRRPA